MLGRMGASSAPVAVHGIATRRLIFLRFSNLACHCFSVSLSCCRLYCSLCRLCLSSAPSIASVYLTRTKMIC